MFQKEIAYQRRRHLVLSHLLHFSETSENTQSLQSMLKFLLSRVARLVCCLSSLVLGLQLGLILNWWLNKPGGFLIRCVLLHPQEFSLHPTASEVYFLTTLRWSPRVYAM